jgi:hypothetical protein
VPERSVFDETATRPEGVGAHGDGTHRHERLAGRCQNTSPWGLDRWRSRIWRPTGQRCARE